MQSLQFQGRRCVQLRRPGDKLLRKPLSSSWPETLSIGKNWGLTWTPEWRSQRKEGASTDSNTKRCTTSVSTSNLDFCISYFLRVTSADFERHIFKGSHFRSFFSTSLLWTVNTRKEFSRDWIKSIRKASTRKGLCVRPSWKSTARPRNSQTSRTDISRD